jgi:hypothetical protein
VPERNKGWDERDIKRKKRTLNPKSHGHKSKIKK